MDADHAGSGSPDTVNTSRRSSRQIRALPPASDVNPFFIAGIGSSAGGLEATEQFFRHLPADSGIAFVLVPHLSPEHKGLLPELLQRYTKMKVFQAEDGMQVQPNGVYVIPPGKNLSILHANLQLLDFPTPHGIRMPIDFFFRQLADDQAENAIGIILSGMGTDGTLGVKAIKENFGLTIVQDLQSAKFEGMPRSAIDTDLIDYVLDVEEMPGRLLEYIQRSRHPSLRKDIREQKSVNALQKVFTLLRAHTGNDFSFYKMNSVMRRIERRMGIHQTDDITHYVHYLQGSPQELDLLFKEFLIGVTRFFRDQDAFEALRTKAIPTLLKEKARNDVVRVWVPGCSTGEEAYSLDILLRECLETLKLTGRPKIQIFATDIDEPTIQRARQGVFPANIAADVSPERLERFFGEEGSSFQINKEVREMVVFAVQNLLLDPPFTRLDLLSCRNLLIYLTPETQQKLLLLFHYALNPDGLLFLGSAETIGEYTDLFDIVDGPCKIYRRKTSAAATGGRIEIPSAPVAYRGLKAQSVRPLQKEGEKALSELTERLLLNNFTPPAALVTDKGDILYINGRTGNYLELPAGKANMNLFTMAREGLRLELASALHQAAKQQSDVLVKGIRVKTNGDYETIDLTVRPIHEPEGLRGLLMVVFQSAQPRETPASRRHSKAAPTGPEAIRITELKGELAATKERLQYVSEQMGTSREELQSATEELESTNEELQSTNEELMTSREEMESLNEELLTVNAELRTKNEELSRTYDDMKNLLNGMEVATIFLDDRLNIKRFTPKITQIINLIPSDIGRPVGDIALNLRYEDLVADAKQVLETLVYKEIQVQTKEMRWYLLRITPYRTLKNVIDGVVITFVDITQLKQLEISLVDRESLLQESRDFAANIIETLREPFLVLNTDMQIISANRAFYNLFRTTPTDTEMRSLYSLGNGQWNIPDLRKLLEEILPGHTQFQDFKIEHDFPAIGHKTIVLNARQLYREQKNHSHPMILLAMEDMTKLSS